MRPQTTVIWARARIEVQHHPDCQAQPVLKIDDNSSMGPAITATCACMAAEVSTVRLDEARF